MSKVSMAQAAKIFAVSRPSLAKHLKKGKISGEKVGENWQLDMSELKRVYPYRDAKTATDEHATLSGRAGDSSQELQAENNLWRAKLEAAEAMVEERGRHIEDLRKLLERPVRGAQDTPKPRNWWPFGSG